MQRRMSARRPEPSVREAASLPESARRDDREQAKLSRALAGDYFAFREIYEIYLSRVFLFIRVRVGDDERARRLTEKVLAEFFDARALRRGESPARRALMLARRALDAELR